MEAPSSPATDIYAAAAVFFECLTGKTPFSGRTARLRQQHESVAVPLDQIPETALRSLIVRGMAKDPADRPPDAIAFVAELEAVATAAYGADSENEAAVTWPSGSRSCCRCCSWAAARSGRQVPRPRLAGSAGAGSWTSAVKPCAPGIRCASRGKALAAASVATAPVVVVAVAVVALGLTGNNPPTAQLTSLSSAVSTTLPTVQAAVSPPVAASNCIAPTSFSYQGTITATAPGPVSYRWLYSSGQQGPVQTVDSPRRGTGR